MQAPRRGVLKRPRPGPQEGTTRGGVGSGASDTCGGHDAHVRSLWCMELGGWVAQGSGVEEEEDVHLPVDRSRPPRGEIRETHLAPPGDPHK